VVERTQDRLWEVILMQWMLKRPASVFNRLTKAEKYATLVTPTPIKRNHEKRTRNTRGILGYVVCV
jgi:hypothetical protein